MEETWGILEQLPHPGGGHRHHPKPESGRQFLRETWGLQQWGAQWPIEAALRWGVCPLCSMLGVRRPRAPTARPPLLPWASVYIAPAFTHGSPRFSPSPGLELESRHALGLQVRLPLLGNLVRLPAPSLGW